MMGCNSGKFRKENRKAKTAIQIKIEDFILIKNSLIIGREGYQSSGGLVPTSFQESFSKMSQ